MVLETFTSLCMTKPNFQEKLFLPQKLEKCAKIVQRYGFLNLKKNLVISFHWICSIMKIYTICSVPAQNVYLGKFMFVRYGQNTLSQSYCRIFISFISPDQINETASFFACWYKFTKIKSWLNIFVLAWSEIGVANLVSGLWTLKMTVSQEWEWTVGMNCWNELFFCVLVQIQES